MKNYTIVPLSEYSDKSGIKEKAFEAILDGLLAVNDKGIALSVPTGKEKFLRGKMLKMASSIPISPVPKIIRMKNGKFALLCIFLEDEPTGKTYEKVMHVEQRYFSEFLMPLFKFIDKSLQRNDLINFFQRLYFSDKKFVKLKNQWLRAYGQKNISAREGQYENAAKARDEEKKMEKKIYEYLFPKVQAYIKDNPGLIMEGWMKFATEEC